MRGFGASDGTTVQPAGSPPPFPANCAHILARRGHGGNTLHNTLADGAIADTSQADR